MKEAADAAATSAALQDEAATSSMNPPTTTMAGADPMHVELPMEQAQFDVEIPEVTPQRSELEEMPESRKVRKINGLAVCSIDTVGAAQADYYDPRSSDDDRKRKAADESDAVHTHEGEPMKSFEVPVPERDIVGVKSGVVLDPVKVQVARQKEIDSIARHEVVELVKTSECKQGTHVKGGSRTTRVTSFVPASWRSRWLTTRETTSAKQLLRCSSSVSCSASRSPSRRFSAAALLCCPFGTFQWRSFPQ